MSLGWSSDGGKVIVGLSNGSIAIYSKQPNGTFNILQTLNNIHSQNVYVSAAQNKFVSCSVGDTKTLIWNFNSTKGIYELNQTVNGDNGCSSISFASNLLRIATAHTNGNLFIYQAINNTFSNGSAPTTIGPVVSGKSSVSFNPTTLIFSVINANKGL